MKNQKIVRGIVNQLFYSKEKMIEDKLPTHVEDQLVGTEEVVDKIPTSVSDQLSSQKKDIKGEFNIEIKKAVRHFHYKIDTNKSKNNIYFSLVYPFYSRQNIAKLRLWVEKKVIEARKENSPIQLMYITKHKDALIITSLFKIEEWTKKEVQSKLSSLLEEIEKFWPFKY